MTTRGIAALESLSTTVLALGDTLTDAVWAQPSGCPGWSNHDVLIHLVCTLRAVVEPQTLPAPVAGSIERSNDVAVAVNRGSGPGRTMTDYRRLLEPALETLTRMQGEPAAGEVVDFDDAGVYPAHLIADSLVFDQYCHLRHDLRPPRGTLEFLEVEADETVMGASLTWLIAGLPQMSPPRLATAVTAPVQLNLSGQGGGTWTLTPAPEGESVTVRRGPAPDAEARVASTADAFHLWGTGRAHWRDAGVSIGGDTGLATAVIDAIHVF
ncbi:maleylpyruvate isomerase N-terminal domain-containing protein [Streptomyces fuscichromogenes]|uniref:maleylpyruvate isomerase N-terminal domain-containing protein n=1 Tax=Streptomyces fuscichromogenes TaxID=1324013 RepID=UPI00381D0EB5